MKKEFLQDDQILDSAKLVASKEMVLQRGPNGGMYIVCPYPCRNCGGWFWCKFFFSCRTSRWNHRHLCTPCEKPVKRLHYINNREKIKAKAKDHYKKNSKRILQQQKKYKQRRD